MAVVYEQFSLDRMVRAVEKVKERLLRAARALDGAEIPYAVVGGNAIAAWVTRVDETAVRNTRDVDIMIHRPDFNSAKLALQTAGFVYRRIAGVDIFLDGAGATARDAVHIIYAGELVRPHEPLPNPDLSRSERADDYQVLDLEALVQIKLTAYRDKDRTHLRDLLEVGLIDFTWCNRFPPPLADRLRHLIDTPGG